MLVRIVVQQQIRERGHEAQPAIVPALLELAVALFLRSLDGRGGVDREIDAGGLGLGALAHLRIARLHLPHIIGIERPVVRRHGVVGRALEHGEVFGLLGHHRDRLDGRGARADHAHRLAGEVDALMRPVAGVIGWPLEVFQAGNLRRVRRGQATHRGNDEARRDFFGRAGGAGLPRLDPPQVGGLVESGLRDSRLKAHVTAQVVAVGDVVGVAQQFGLGGVALRPFPFLLQLGRELIGILHAFDVAARAGIAVPVPGAADALAGLEHTRRETLLAKPVQHVHAAEACADDDRIEIDRHASPRNCGSR